MGELGEEEQRAVVAAIRRCELRAAEAAAAGTRANERYWQGVAFGLNHAMRIVFGSDIADRIAAEVTEPARAEKTAVTW